MNLHRMLAARAAERRPLTVGLIGAGKFGSMYLAQAKHTPGIHVVGVADLAPERARASLERTGWLPERFAATSFAHAAKSGDDVRHRRCARAHRRARNLDRHRRHRQSRRRHPARARLLRAAQAHRDGERRGRRARGTAARAARTRCRHRLFARVRRSAGADLRDRRLVSRGWICGRRRRQGHEVPARVSRVDAVDRVAALRFHGGNGRRRRFQRADVQLVPRRHEKRDRDGGRRQRDRSRAGARRARVPAVRRRRSSARAASARARRIAASRGPGRGDLERRARRPPGVPRPALGRVRDVRGGRRSRRRLCAQVLSRIRLLDRSVGPLLRRCTSPTTRSDSSSA